MITRQELIKDIVHAIREDLIPSLAEHYSEKSIYADFGGETDIPLWGGYRAIVEIDGFNVCVSDIYSTHHTDRSHLWIAEAVEKELDGGQLLDDAAELCRKHRREALEYAEEEYRLRTASYTW